MSTAPNNLPSSDDAPASAQSLGSLLHASFDRFLDIERRYHKYEDGHKMTDEQLAEMNAALGLTKDKDYRPYCLRCDLMPRVALKREGFWCWNCGNAFGFNLQRLAENNQV